MSNEQEAQQAIKNFGYTAKIENDLTPKNELRKRIAEQTGKLKSLIERKNWILVNKTEDAL